MSGGEGGGDEEDFLHRTPFLIKKKLWAFSQAYFLMTKFFCQILKSPLYRGEGRGGGDQRSSTNIIFIIIIMDKSIKDIVR